MVSLLEHYHLLSYESLDSTNEEAKRLAQGGGGHGAVLWAKKQSAGRGRMGRPWVSLDGNLFVSVLLSPPQSQAEWAQLSFVAALATQEAIQPLLPDGMALRVKWPNDLMLENKKLGGILLESFTTQAEDGRPAQSWVVVGVGVNIDACPAETEIPAMHLKAAGVEIVSAKIVLSRFIHHFVLRYDQWQAQGFAPIRDDWAKLAHPRGTPMRARLMTETLEGTFNGIDADGNCLMTLADGSARSIVAGDVFFDAPKSRAQ